jgi:predicted secreted protein
MVGEGEASKIIGYVKDGISVATMSYSVANIKSPFDVISIGTDAT